MSSDLLYQYRTLQLASYGLGQASPAPLMGWVFVKDAAVVAEGWRTAAPLMVSFASSVVGSNVQESWLYCNVSPFTGLNNPEELLAFLESQQIKGLVLPEKAISEETLKKLHFITRTMPDTTEAAWLNRRFFTWQHKKRPYIILKWAETADGFIARENYDSKWISNVHARKLVHQWRSQEDAIMAGTNTIQYDNPQLNVRDWTGTNPVRVIIDKKLRLDPQAHVFDGQQPTLCYTLSRNEICGSLQYISLKNANNTLFMKALLYDLYGKKIQSMFVEGGASLLSFLILQGWWDEARVFRADIRFGEGIRAPQLQDAILLRQEDVSGNDLQVYQKLNRK